MVNCLVGCPQPLLECIDAAHVRYEVFLSWAAVEWLFTGIILLVFYHKIMLQSDWSHNLLSIYSLAQYFAAFKRLPVFQMECIFFSLEGEDQAGK